MTAAVVFKHAPHLPDHASSSAEQSNRVVTAKPARGHSIPTDAVRTLGQGCHRGRARKRGDGALNHASLDACSQEEREAYEEIVRLRQERAQFLQRIRSLELQQEKQKQEVKGGVHQQQSRSQDF